MNTVGLFRKKVGQSVLKKALSLHHKGQFAKAATLYRKILAQNPKNADALHLLGVIEYQRKNPSAAIALIDRAIKLSPNNAVFFSNRGNALKDLKHLDEALASYDSALAIKPDFAEALNNRGNTLQELKRFDDALESYHRCLAIKPAYAKALNSRGNALRELKRFDDALASYDRALATKPDFAEALNNRGNTLRDLNRFEEALTNYDRALAIKADYAAALSNRGIVLRDLKRFVEALNSFDRALAIEPDNAFLFGLRLNCQMMICDWRGLGDNFCRLAEIIASGRKASGPFFVLATPLSAALQKSCSEIYVREECPGNSLLPRIEGVYKHGRIRLGYFSADLHNHPIAYLAAELFERHDRAKFEVIAFSFAPPTRDAMRMRLEKAFDRFFEVSAMSDKGVALLARSLEIDIAVDLNGFTQGNRTDVFAMRAAPIQVNYLGYPGTMGADYIDYLIADSIVIPENQQQHYAEKIAYLPDTYLANDATRVISGKDFSRAGCGLPEQGFAFCCLNNSYKITPELFDIWMRLLDTVEGCTLWLPQSNEGAMHNLQQGAKARGIDPKRVVFIPFLPNMEDHLARLKLADLFLDTLPFNAHTTASDALWAGLPVLTCLGNTFPGRVAASLLNAIGLPELITYNLDEYEALALKLAINPQWLLSLRQKLAVNRSTHRLFDTAAFTKHIESAYVSMWTRHQARLAPEHIYVRSEITERPQDVCVRPT